MKKTRFGKANPLAVGLMRGVLIPSLHAMWRPRLEGREHMPTSGPCFVYGNHCNYLDPFIMNILMPWEPTAGVMTREFMRGGPIAYLMREIGILPVSRNDAGLMRAIFKLIREERMITIYPEGGRRWAGLPMPWIPATAKLWVKSGLPIHPVIVHGSYVSWPRWATYPRPARLRVEFLPPLQFERNADLENARAKLKAPMDFDECFPPADVQPKRAYRPADGISTLLYRDPVTGANAPLFTPDGTHVRNQDGSLNYKMHPDSLLEDLDTGEWHSTSALYTRIRTMPPVREANGALLSNPVEVDRADPYPEFKSLGEARADLFDDALRLTFDDRVETIPISDLDFIQIQRNWKFQFYIGETLTQLGLKHGGSALQWQDVLQDQGVETR